MSANLSDIIANIDAENHLARIINSINQKGPINLSEFETLAYIKKFQSQIFIRYERKVVNVLGLFYKTTEPQGLLEEIYNIFSDSIEEETGRKFTPVQADAFNKIWDNTYFSFSAPTSAGKSYLFRELLLSTMGDILIIVPSRALIAEYFIKVNEIMDKSVLVSQFIENINIKHTSKRVFIITPERGVDLFKNIANFNIELILLDEAQISEEGIRGMRFDSLVRRIDKFIPSAKKVFTHPFVLNPEAQLSKHNFATNADHYCYKQNSVGKIYQYIKDDELTYFSPFEVGNKFQVKAEENIIEKTLQRNGTVLIYVSKNKIYDGRYLIDFERYIKFCEKITNPVAVEIIAELRTYIGASNSDEEKHSLMIEMMERGIVIHHGSIPLRARLIIERFVNANYAKICFSTSTLIQGINMPFDVVWISNFKFTGSDIQKNLDLKNLIGRAGRSTKLENIFDFGYVVIEKSNVSTFKKRMQEPTVLTTTSRIDDDIQSVPEDVKDVVQAIKNDSFNDELQLTTTQVDRIMNANIDGDIKYILDNFIINGLIVNGEDYYNLTNTVRTNVKNAFKNIFIAHLRRTSLNKGEQSVLSAAIPVLLWQIQGKSFAEIVSLRLSYLTSKSEQRRINREVRIGQITGEVGAEELKNLTIKYSQPASQLPNQELTATGLFPRGTPISEIEYDLVVFDTYDYLDKVIGYSLTDPLAAAFQLYFQKTADVRAETMKNFIKYGTNEGVEIWLLRYGFGFEEVDWIKNYVDKIDEYEIVFRDNISELSEQEMAIISRYVYPNDN